MNQEFRDKSGKLLGRIKKVGNKLELRDGNAKLLGRYDSATDRTTGSNGKLIGKGNLLSGLL